MSALEDEGIHAEKAEVMREYRDSWDAAEIKQLNVLIPVNRRKYYSAISKIDTGRHLYDLIEAGDVNPHIFGNKRLPRRIISADLIRHKKACSAAEQTERYWNHANNVFNMMNEASIKGKSALAADDADGIAFWFAREYALCYYLSGILEIIEMTVNGTLPVDRWIGE